MEEKQQKKLDSFVRAINRDIDVQIEDMRLAAKKQGEQLCSEHIAAAQAEAEERIRRALEDSEAAFRRQLAQTELDCRRAVLAHRESLITELFDSIRARLTAYTASDAYPDYLCALLRGESLSGAVLHLCKRDMVHRTELQSLAGGCEITADPAISLGGLAIYYPQEQKIIDKTLDTAFDEQRRAFCNTAALRL